MDEKLKQNFNGLCELLILVHDSRLQIGKTFIGYRNDMDMFSVYTAKNTEPEYFKNRQALWDYLIDSELIHGYGNERNT